MMSDFDGIFEELAADDSDERVASRKALAVSNKRVKDRFGAFLAAANTSSEYQARLGLIRDDLSETVAAVASDLGGDPSKIEASILKHLAWNEPIETGPADAYAQQPGQDRAGDMGAIRQQVEQNAQEQYGDPCKGCGVPFVGADGGATCPNCGLDNFAAQDTLPGQQFPKPEDMGRTYGDDTSDPYSGGGLISRTARRPKLCPYHSEVMDISLAADDPRAGFEAMSQHAWSANHCQGGEYEGNRCGFKPEMVTTKFWEEKAEKAQERREERERQQQEFTPEVTVPDSPEGIEDVDSLPDEEVTFDDGGEPVEELTEAPMLEPMAASTKQALTPVDPAAQQAWLLGGEPPPAAPLPSPAQTTMNNLGIAAPANATSYNPAGQTAPHVPAKSYQGPAPAAGMSMQQMQHQNTQALQDVKNPGQYNQDHYRGVDITGPASGGGSNPGHPVPGRRGAWVISEALETVDIEKDTHPDFSRSRTPGERPDTEMSGSPHPTKEIDILKPVATQLDGEDFLEGTKAVTENIDITKSVGPQKGETGTWTENNNASPVTSAAVDPAQNPIRKILEDQFGGFVPQSQVQAAIAKAENDSQQS